MIAAPHLFDGGNGQFEGLKGGFELLQTAQGPGFSSQQLDEFHFQLDPVGFRIGLQIARRRRKSRHDALQSKLILLHGSDKIFLICIYAGNMAAHFGDAMYERRAAVFEALQGQLKIAQG